MAMRIKEALHPHHRTSAENAQRRAVWDFVSTVADWRCSLCFKAIEYRDLKVFGRTRLCPTCSCAVNDEFSGFTLERQERAQ
jgi:hypothetical protein